jgi:hypothetical protein
MAFLSKDNIKAERRRRGINSSGVYDTINFILGIVIIILALFIFIDRIKYERMFAAVFIFAAAMNMCMGIKYYHRRELAKTISLGIASVFFVAMTVISFMALWN